MFSVEWDISKAIEGLQSMLARVLDLTPAWRNLVKYYRERATPQTFASQGQRIGEVWAPLSNPYAKYKAIKWPGQPILRASDRLFRSLTVADATDAIEDITSQSLIYGTATPYASYHQKGVGKLPRRAILAVTEADRREMARIVRAHLDNQGRLSGFERI